MIRDENFLFSFGGADWYGLTLGGNVNVEGLAAIYAATPEIGVAEPDLLIGGSNFWVPTAGLSGTWQWDIDDGWQDCFDGCDCHRVYVIETTAQGDITLIDFQEFGAPWCDFK